MNWSYTPNCHQQTDTKIHSYTHTLIHTHMHTVKATRARQSTNQILSRYFLWNFNNSHMHRTGTTHTYLTHIHTHTYAHWHSSWSTTWLRHVANMTWYCRMLFLLLLLLILLYATPAPPPLCCCLRLHSATRNTLTHIHTLTQTHAQGAAITNLF